MGKEKSLRKQIEQNLLQQINALFELDKGKLEIVRVRKGDGRVVVRLGGSYSGSPYRDFLIKFVVEPLLKAEFDSVKSVEWTD